MSNCTQCGQNVVVDDYRTNAIPEGQTKPQTERQLKLSPRGQKLWANVKYLLTGLIVLATITSSVWLLFPGLTYLGEWLASILHIQLAIYRQPDIVAWMIGLITLVLPPLTYGLLRFAHFLGKKLVNEGWRSIWGILP